ncbi:MAG TPA: hypothetical protein DD670_02110 [Planctomycetaceae bacterium]|nr:hypothetical protein [Planctomycetaceae bacterium]
MQCDAILCLNGAACQHCRENRPAGQSVCHFDTDSGCGQKKAPDGRSHREPFRFLEIKLRQPAV